MGLFFFTQRDIDNFEVNNIPEEFINYFNGLSKERQEEIILSRPDLSAALNYESQINESEISEEIDVENDDSIFSEEDFPEIEKTNLEVSIDEELELENIIENNQEDFSNNPYSEIKDFKMYEDKELIPFETFTIENSVDYCLIHSMNLEKINLRYKNGKSVYGVAPLVCPKCKRLYLKEKDVAIVKDNIEKMGYEVRIYSLEETNRFLNSNLKPEVLNQDSIIYVASEWIEDNPTCSDDNVKLMKLPCEYKKNTEGLEFVVYLCPKCRKIFVRRSIALDIQDKCHNLGITPPELVVQKQRTYKEDRDNQKNYILNFVVENGKVKKSTVKYPEDVIWLTENDIVVVSEGAYCNHESHFNEECIIAFFIVRKGDTKKSYAFEASYCRDCEKFYISQLDYDSIYNIGRPDVSIVVDVLDGSYNITSGEVFNEEKKHLEGLENELENRIDDIKSENDYVSQYATFSGGYDDSLTYAKSNSKRKYEGELDLLYSYMPKPYRYRVEIESEDGDSKVFYLGAKDVVLNGEKKVISFMSPFGRELVNVQTRKVERNGIEYSIKLSREFDIYDAKLYGYNNLKSDEDIIFKKGITDPYLRNVLAIRKKQRNLVDIIATIQENQNSIVDESYFKNIIVQGCAGSGKTMVLLHRLSSLIYRHPEIDADKYVILTPNETFNLHIRGIADELQLSGIERMSIEQYYKYFLGKYDTAFLAIKKVDEDMKQSSKFVEYVYSDTFLKDLDNAYKKEIEKRKKKFLDLQEISVEFGKAVKGLNDENEFTYAFNFRMKVEGYKNLIEINKQNIEDETLKLRQEKINLKAREEAYLKSNEEYVTSIQELPDKIKNVIIEKINENQIEEEKINNTIAELNTRVEKEKSAFINIGRARKIQRIQEKIDENLNELKKLDNVKKQYVTMLNYDYESKALDEISAICVTMLDALKLVKDCENLSKRLDRRTKELNACKTRIEKISNKLANLKENEKSEELYERINKLYKESLDWQVKKTFNNIFLKASRKFREENKVELKGGLHRYDLYVRLYLCKKYFNKTYGSYEFISIDEGQDLAVNEIKLIMSMNKKKPYLNIYGDINQCIFKERGITDWSELKNKYEANMFVLNENYRNTNQITKFCNKNFDMSVQQTGVDGAVVSELNLKRLKDAIKDMSYDDSRIAIIVSRKLDKNYVFSKKDLKELNRISEESTGKGIISFMTVEQVKGIEFDKVFVLPNKMSKNEKYIAYTRAQSELVILVDDEVMY
ncbi:UvrD-helicase domain-containing protein [Lachnospira multipara]|uniref:UvrD-helicase domain-containing protein n=1 Tax=Lachnospira multipara TaxID=28051 RepID=UPI0004E27ACD|nr:UvrD-helicase domain-containing protein [Lachnospira multipara]